MLEPGSLGLQWLQVACLMLADPVPLRVHWPRNADLRMNNMMYKPYARGPNAKLGVNSRDDMASVGIMVTPVRLQASYLPGPVRRRSPILIRKHPALQLWVVTGGGVCMSMLCVEGVTGVCRAGTGYTCTP